ncbi:MAG: 3-hydroxyacyl-CoA dehydrogenase family protein [Lachnospiraceae bacterium]|jgi:3-hydroxybutyryl-CoA dehydrogenase|uniref:3-hydroxyacyl-CoA dehydrogenase family protein n=1 Tax=Clostridium sp. (strain SY8519) TaxID=1042156 RepID=UPI000217208B|nr:3-hydroxyacyl-CoA dehydrogenase family protein [Clostridium sp. SY8519]MCI1655310.1 3-hydroxyacyl-CoA dehydrogenase family protein [Lachnospiraceae bacterium]MCI1657605.1 3-hydroxyacyl-CoA dehydrogenase family protein [Lachnospiraceae bacterium]MCI2195981.1 3-hydroxyacyl-CoA dehydrogenase family protein [Lachnospiraceae bacterium]BAK46210.1 3-Hydroxyacyl-CoA dehydrogenase [Clostridium sp. SY8519]HAD18901.1 3-hydroxyacyl-CoA dehydrogenase family protein [Lachnospiraceae bacterium]
MKEIKNFVICGGGMMGCAIAQVFCTIPDAQVTIWNHREKDIAGMIRQNMKELVAHGVVTEADVDSVVERVVLVTDLNHDRVKAADLVVECVPEVMETKQNLFRDLESITSEDCIYCTNTSVMSPTEISEKCQHKERICGTHFWNPGFLIPLVEVVKTKDTTEEVMQAVMDIMTKAGKKPIYCKKDVPGFVANRMQHALWREAISIVEQGIADPKTVDDAVKYSFGLRLPQLGPIENSDMVSTTLTYNIHNYVLQYLADNHEPSPLLSEMIKEGKEGFKSGEGFLKWDAESVQASKDGLNEYLIKMIYGK